MRSPLYAALALLIPAHAYAQSLQFDTAPAAPVSSGPQAPAGIKWLQNKPMTVFDLGMMELTQTANQLAESVSGLRGAVAELQDNSNTIAISFYAGLPYTTDVCKNTLRQMRDGMFAQRGNPERLARELSSYFISYGPTDPTRPSTIGAELLQMMRVAVYMQGGMCEANLTDDSISEQRDAASAAEAPPPAASPPPAAPTAPPATPPAAPNRTRAR